MTLFFLTVGLSIGLGFLAGLLVGIRGERERLRKQQAKDIKSICTVTRHYYENQPYKFKNN